jgi:hypothetical protein
LSNEEKLEEMFQKKKRRDDGLDESNSKQEEKSD